MSLSSFMPNTHSLYISLSPSLSLSLPFYLSLSQQSFTQSVFSPSICISPQLSSFLSIFLPLHISFSLSKLCSSLYQLSSSLFKLSSSLCQLSSSTSIFFTLYIPVSISYLHLSIYLSIYLSPSFFQSSSVSISISLPLFRLNALGTISNWKWLTREGERATKREGRNENEKCFDDKLAKKKTSSDQVSWKKELRW